VDYFRRYRRCLFPCYPLINVDTKMMQSNPNIHFASAMPLAAATGTRPHLSILNNAVTPPRSASAAAAATDATATKPRAHRTRRHPLHLRVLHSPGLVYVVAPRHRRQMPAWADNVDAPVLFLCPYYDAATNAGCPYGSTCEMVHADLSEATCHRVHEKCPSWTMLEDVPYPRHEPGTTYNVTPPNSDSAAVTFEMIPSHHVIVTNAVRSGRTPLSHCAHFIQKGTCDLGEDCRFAHVVRIAGVTDTPLPAITDNRNAFPSVTAGAATMVSLPSFGESTDEDDDGAHSPGGSRPRDASGSGNSWVVSSAASHTSCTAAQRFRHNPYSAVAREQQQAGQSQHHHNTSSASASFA
jgi:hypothetical protein